MHGIHSSRKLQLAFISSFGGLRADWQSLGRLLLSLRDVNQVALTILITPFLHCPSTREQKRKRLLLLPLLLVFLLVVSLRIIFVVPLTIIFVVPLGVFSWSVFDGAP